jgi:Fic family protein
MNDELDRHSRALEADLISDPDERAAREAQNGLRQFDAVVELANFYLQGGHAFRLRLSHLLTLHRTALEGITAYAGNFRPSEIEIHGSKHKPVPAHLVPTHVEELCDYVNENWERQSPIHLAAYVLWRLNWIHPFTDGNGRTARAASYLVLCVRLGYLLPGTNTIPEQIATNKAPYYEALEAADEYWKQDKLDLSMLEQLLSGLLANQLLSLHREAIQSAPEVKSEQSGRKFH